MKRNREERPSKLKHCVESFGSQHGPNLVADFYYLSLANCEIACYCFVLIRSGIKWPRILRANVEGGLAMNSHWLVCNVRYVHR